MKYMDVFHTKCMEQFAQAPPARRASIMEDTSESRAVKRLPTSQYVVGLFVFGTERWLGSDSQFDYFVRNKIEGAEHCQKGVRQEA
jgi:hypothetical protein